MLVGYQHSSRASHRTATCRRWDYARKVNQGDATTLIGSWRTDRNDQWSMREYGDVSLRFDGKGNLTYIVHLPGKKQVLRLMYSVEGTWLLTDQPSSPRVERAEFFFTEDGRLAIQNVSSASPTFYIREGK